MSDKSEIIIYQTEDGLTKIDVRLEDDTVWLTQAEMAELFQKLRCPQLKRSDANLLVTARRG